ncbi:unnamed protein product [Moneuplotes crassus]|uniref:Uncharacterized protein n=1 Tax=Euplotes crassus TaxID=5936 RepID=A0AAD1U4A0_EUPCR|nr:unnamed protein product [Moneuplotes crassus]
MIVFKGLANHSCTPSLLLVCSLHLASEDRNISNTSQDLKAIFIVLASIL